MGKISLKDQNIMNEIIDTSKVISNIYQRLFFEHSQNGMDTVNYKELVEKLKEYLVAEQDLYDRLKLNPYKLSDLKEFLMLTEKRVSSDENNVLVSIYNSADEDFYPYRILNKLNSMVFKTNEEWVNYLLDSGYMISKKDAYKYVGFRRLHETIENDFENTFLFYIDEKIESSTSDKEKDFFIRIKYNLSYISPNAEYAVISDNLDKGIYFSYPLVVEAYKINKDFDCDIRFKACHDYCDQAMSNIFVKDELISTDLELDFQVFSIYMKAGLSLIFTFNDYDYLMESLKEEIESINESTNNRMRISTNFLINIVDDIDKEKEKCKYLHLIPPK